MGPLKELSRVVIDATNFDAATQIGESPRLRKMDDLSQYALAAANQAVREARWIVPKETALVLATQFGPLDSARHFLESIKKNGVHAADPFLFPNTVINMALGYISLAMGLQGMSFTLIGDFEQALATAEKILVLGRASLVLAGYVEIDNSFVPGLNLKPRAIFSLLKLM